jgi:hypothetical protein
MLESAPLLIAMAISLPLIIYSLTPLLVKAYSVIGRKFVFVIAMINKECLSLHGRDKNAIYKITLKLNHCSNHNNMEVIYSYYTVERKLAAITIQIGEEVELYALESITKHFGWSPSTAYARRRVFRNSILVYLPFFFIGAIPFISSCYYLVSKRNLVFDIIRYFNVV